MEDSPNPRVLLPAIAVGLVLFAGAYIAFTAAKSRSGTIVLPGGVTYLGPTPTPRSAEWKTYTGKTYPYSFRYPASFSPGFFPNDPYDAVTVFLPGTNSSDNIFFRVDDLAKLKKQQYAGATESYAKNWWKDYSWKGVSSVTAFTNAGGLSGYRVKYTDTAGNTPYDHVFFSVPNRPDLVIWISGKLFTPEEFETLVDSVAWTVK